ncbi:MAG: glycosyltransferase [Alistipes sp.]|nr:glycosyltransferase [Alistipes sp.]
MEKTSIDISVIVPVYKVEKYVERCVRSLMEQTLKDNIEFIFVDDCSPDNSLAILQETIRQYPQREPAVTVLHHDRNRGVAAARQTGFARATGKYIIHCDADDWTEPQLYETLLHTAEQHGADIVGCAYYANRPAETEIVDYPFDEETLDTINRSEPSLLYCALWNKLIKKELYTANGIRCFEKINMYEDVGVTTRLRAMSAKTIFVHTPLYHYNQENCNAMTAQLSPSAISQQIECAALLERWFDERRLTQFKPQIDAIKFFSKLGLIVVPASADPRRWRQTFPETNANGWRYGSVSLVNKLLVTLVRYDLIAAYNAAGKIKNLLRGNRSC